MLQQHKNFLPFIYTICGCVRVCGSVWGVCWVFYYFCWLHDNKFAFKSPSPSPLPSLLSSRRLARSVFAFFFLLPGTFFSGLLFCLRSTFWAPLQTVCVCVCGYTHNIINHKVSHDFILTPDLPLCLLPNGCSAAPALAWLQLAGLYFWGHAALRDFRR